MKPALWRYFSKRYDNFNTTNHAQSFRKEVDLDELISASGYKKEIAELNELILIQNQIEKKEVESEDSNDDDDEEESCQDNDEEESCQDNDEESDGQFNASDDDEVDRLKDDNDSDLEKDLQPDDDSAAKLESNTNSVNVEDAEGEEAADTQSLSDGKISPLLEDRARDATFDATMDMYFKSLKKENMLVNGASALPTLVEDHELTAETLASAATAAARPSVSPTDDIDTASQASRRSSKGSRGKNTKYNNTGQKLDPEARKALMKKVLLLRQERIRCEAAGEPVPNLLESLETCTIEDDGLSGISYSTASTINPVVLKQRAKKEVLKKERKQISKKNLRAKGEANAYTRMKKENDNTIKQSMACADVWG